MRHTHLQTPNKAPVRTLALLGALPSACAMLMIEGLIRTLYALPTGGSTPQG